LNNLSSCLFARVGFNINKDMASNEICVLKVILSDWRGRIRGRPYRTLAVPAEFSLYDLAEIIVDSFDFDFDHAFGFYDNVKDWTASKECYELFKDLEQEGDLLIEPSPCQSVKRTRLGEVFTEDRKRWLFLFDYGDEWHFIVDFKGMKPPEEGVSYPCLLESFGEAPPQYWGEGEME